VAVRADAQTEAALLEILESFCSGFAARDADGVMRLFAPDADVVMVTSEAPLLRGPDEMRTFREGCNPAWRVLAACPRRRAAVRQGVVSTEGSTRSRILVSRVSRRAPARGGAGRLSGRCERGRASARPRALVGGVDGVLHAHRTGVAIAKPATVVGSRGVLSSQELLHLAEREVGTASS